MAKQMNSAGNISTLQPCYCDTGGNLRRMIVGTCRVLDKARNLIPVKIPTWEEEEARWIGELVQQHSTAGAVGTVLSVPRGCVWSKHNALSDCSAILSLCLGLCVEEKWFVWRSKNFLCQVVLLCYSGGACLALRGALLQGNRHQTAMEEVFVGLWFPCDFDCLLLLLASAIYLALRTGEFSWMSADFIVGRMLKIRVLSSALGLSYISRTHSKLNNTTQRSGWSCQ